jgi:hypothetical protein
MQLVTIPEAAESLGATQAEVQQYLRDGELVAVRGDDGVPRIPALLLQDGRPVKSLRAVITLLRDARYADEEIVDWLFRADDTLPGSPIEALRQNRGTEVKRRAQASGF